MPSHFVLVHGAYHGAWCWQRLTPLLEAQGATVTAPDLPGHGRDQTATRDLTLPGYADHLAEIIRTGAEPVTLVGHSMAGAVISEVAERVPNRLSRLVFLTAYMPGDGECIGDWARKDGSSKARSERVEIDGVPCLVMDRNTAQTAFYQDAGESDLDWVFGQLRPEPIVIFRHRLSLTADRFGTVPRDYISCRNDAGITAELQDQMLVAMPARRVWKLDCGHSPFITVPGDLAKTLVEGEDGGGS